MKVRYMEIIPADCTSDPHPVSYTRVAKAKRLGAALDDIILVCESALVQSVRGVRATLGTTWYETDRYGLDDLYNKHRQAEGDEAVRHKTAGLYWYGDPVEKSGFVLVHLLPGLTGVKELRKRLADVLQDEVFNLSVGVIWTFAGDHGCSDYIKIESDNPNVVDYSSQDSWISNPGYLQWGKDMKKLLGRTQFMMADPKKIG